MLEWLKITRKIHKNSSCKVSWWFIIHASKSVLCNLDRKWDSVNLPTSWLPPPCSKPANSVAAPNEERPVGNNVPVLIVSAPTVNNVADEDEVCGRVLLYQKSMMGLYAMNDHLADKATADLAVTALKENHISQSFFFF